MKNIPCISYALILLLFVGSCRHSTEQTSDGEKVENSSTQNNISNRFENEIRAFERIDSIKGFTTGHILFTGSSSIRMWSTLQEDMAGYRVINRGFGGATIPELDHYAPRFLYPHSPSALVFYCGENDIAEGAEAEDAVREFKNFYKSCRAYWPEILFVYLYMKPSPARWNLWNKYQAANDSIVTFLDREVNSLSIDVGSIMLNDRDRPDPSIYISDSLHMNAAGYARWAKILREEFEKLALNSNDGY